MKHLQLVKANSSCHRNLQEFLRPSFKELHATTDLVLTVSFRQAEHCMIIFFCKAMLPFTILKIFSFELDLLQAIQMAED